MGLIRFFEQKDCIGSFGWSFFPSPSRWSAALDTVSWSVWSSYWRSAQSLVNSLHRNVNVPVFFWKTPSSPKNRIGTVAYVPHHDTTWWSQEIDWPRNSVEDMWYRTCHNCTDTLILSASILIVIYDTLKSITITLETRNDRSGFVWFRSLSYKKNTTLTKEISTKWIRRSIHPHCNGTFTDYSLISVKTVSKWNFPV